VCYKVINMEIQTSIYDYIDENDLLSIQDPIDISFKFICYILLFKIIIDIIFYILLEY